MLTIKFVRKSLDSQSSHIAALFSVASLICRSGKNASEDKVGSAAGDVSAAATSNSATTATEPAASATRNTYTGPLISRAGKRGSTAAFSSTSMGRAAAEDVRQADSSAHYPPQPAYRQASVMDLLNRPHSSSSRPAEDAVHAWAHASGHVPQDGQLQPQAMHQPWSNAGLDRDSTDGGMPPIPEGREFNAGPAPAGRPPTKFAGFPGAAEEVCHSTERGLSIVAPNPLQPEVLDSGQAFPATAANLEADCCEAALSPGSNAEGMHGDQAIAAAGQSDAQPVAIEPPTDEVSLNDRAGHGGPAAEDADARQQAPGQLAEIDAATWARLPASVQASILAGELVDLSAISRAPDAAEPGLQVLLLRLLCLCFHVTETRAEPVRHPGRLPHEASLFISMSRLSL